MRRNRLRELLDADQASLGTHLISSWPSVVELVGLSGMFDYVEFVAEYGPYDLYALENLGRAVELFDHMSAMMKIEQEPRTYLAVRAIGSGIQNVLFSDPRTVEWPPRDTPTTPDTPSRGAFYQKWASKDGN